MNYVSQRILLDPVRPVLTYQIQHFCCKNILNRYIIFLPSNHMTAIPTKEIVENSVILGKCVEHAIHIMKLVYGKEDMFALAKVFLCGLFLGTG